MLPTRRILGSLPILHSSSPPKSSPLFRSFESVLAAKNISQSAARRHPLSEGAMYFTSGDKEGLVDQMMECEGKEACDFKARKRPSEDIIPHILNLYGSRASPQDFEIYAPNASFEDPLMCAHGLKQIKSAFYSLPKVFSDSRIVEYSVKESMTSSGGQEILIDNKQHYRLLGRNIELISLIRLYIEGGKVVHHEDWWNKKPIWNRDTVQIPLAGRAIECARRGSMLLTHALMGFGKDPTV